MKNAQMNVPCLVRIKPGALHRLGLYLARSCLSPVALFHSEGLLDSILDVARQSLLDHGIAAALVHEVKQASVEEGVHLLGAVPSSCKVLIGLGGGKALDVAKYAASLAGLPYFAVPTSLSNDGFCSPQASLTLEGKRRSLPTGLPEAVVVDLAVCQRAPQTLWHSGVGDLCSKFTAVSDWKLAYEKREVPVNDLAALISDASVFQFMANPVPDEQGIRLLATALMLNGVAMEIAGSSRPASGSEHLISHALDVSGARQRLHGLQTGTAAYLVSSLQSGDHHDRIKELFARTGFWESVRKDPFSKEEWRIAVERAPSIKDDFYTILSESDAWPEFARMIAHDQALIGCFE
ncbi:MAG TPA: iron-containing alcohol dehydrogenase family protein [Candidatus Sulfotelmatobacter sp.]|nr:iron-containing alcohol dehydrogenase family protein [Candidatus Sulfotelmatobacter sp.]